MTETQLTRRQEDRLVGMQCRVKRGQRWQEILIATMPRAFFACRAPYGVGVLRGLLAGRDPDWKDDVNNANARRAMWGLTERAPNRDGFCGELFCCC